MDVSFRIMCELQRTVWSPCRLADGKNTHSLSSRVHTHHAQWDSGADWSPQTSMHASLPCYKLSYNFQERGLYCFSLGKCSQVSQKRYACVLWWSLFD